ncbi:MAG: rRNA pseudouridine synthase [Chloroflexi bacterium]|nr:rRNA pseudouridine synthase [Chloroflexota bacterium]
MAEERLQKILARAGLGSRRACEEFIAQGRVTVNGRVAKLGDKADPAKDDIRLDGQRIKPPETPVYIALYKPRFVLSTTESQDGRKTVRDLVPVPERIFPVGRLDLESEGLMLLTNDGDLANRLTHPRYGHEKEYRVLVAKRPDPSQLEAWRHGIVLEDGTRTRPAEVWVERTQGKGAWLRVILKEGKKRQIREMCRLTGLPVVRLVRIRIGPLRLEGLKPGEWRHLTPEEVQALKQGKRPSRSRRRSRR